MRTWRVGIIGGGPGGLMTAYALQKNARSPIRITLFEASERLGGKILTPRFRRSPSPLPVQYEAGAAEFYDYSLFDDDPLKDLIQELGLPIQSMAGSAVIMNNQVIANLDDVREKLGPGVLKALLTFDRNARDRMTPQEFYHSDFPDGAPAVPEWERFDSVLDDVSDPTARDYIENLIHSDLATEPPQTSPAYGLQNYLMNNPAYMNLYSIEGGNERLPQALAARIDAEILLGHPVTSVTKRDSGHLQIQAHPAAGHYAGDFDFVVVALPHNHLKSVAFHGERLAQAMDRHYDYYHYPAHYLRITIQFQTPFWRNQLTDSFWMLDRFGGCCLYDESAREPGSTVGVLGWLLGGTAAEEMSQWDDRRLLEGALESLPDFLAFGREQFVEGHVHRWTHAVNALPAGVVPLHPDLRHQPEPHVHPNLFVVGDYLFDSTLNGVLDSANYVAAWIAATTTDPHQETP